MRLALKLNILTCVGVGIPVIIGALVVGFGRDVISPELLVSAGILGVVQTAVSLWAIVAGWVGKQAAAIEAMSNNYRFADRYCDLAKLPPTALKDLQRQFELIDREERGYSIADVKQGVTEPERRAGMRAALRNFGRACAGCQTVPTDMTATGCGVCGNFSISWLTIKSRRFS